MNPIDFGADAGDDQEEEEDEPAAGASDDDAAADAPSDDAGGDKSDDVDDDGSKSPSAALAPSAQSGGRDPAVLKAWMEANYNKAADPSGLEAAKAQAAKQQFWANIGEGLEGAFKAKSMAVGGAGVDSGFYQGLKQQAQHGVQQAQAERQQAIQDFVTKQKMGQEAVGAGQEEQIRKNEIDASDPSGRASVIGRAAFKANFPDVAAAMGQDFDQLSYKDLGAISQMTDTKAKIQAAKEAAVANREAAQARFQALQAQKATEADSAFVGKVAPIRNKYFESMADLEKQDQLINQAAGSQGGVAGALVKGGALHEALGRVSQGELGMAQDPSLMNRAKALYDKISEGKTLTDTDIKEYRAINATNKAATESAYSKSVQAMADDHDRTWHHEPGFSASLIGLGAPPKTAAGAGPAGATAGQQPAKERPAVGSVITLKGGKKYRVLDDEGNLQENAGDGGQQMKLSDLNPSEIADVQAPAANLRDLDPSAIESVEAPAPASPPSMGERLLAGAKQVAQPAIEGAKQLGQDIAGAPASVEAGASQIGRSIPVAGPAMVKAGHGLAAFLSSITPDTALPPALRGKTIGELYDHFEQQDRETQAKLMAEHPEAALLGALGGGAALPIPGANMEGAAGVATRIGSMGAMAGADTAVRGGDAGDIAKSTILGLGGGALGEAAAPLAAAAKSAANEKMVKAALGNNSAAWRELEAKGPDAVDELGRTLIDEGVGGFGSSAAGIAKRAGEAKQKAWDAIAALFPDVDKALPGGAVSGEDIAKGILDYATKIDSPNNKALVQNLLGQAEEFEKMGMIPMEEAQRLKNQYVFDWKEPTAMSAANNQIKRVIGGEMEQGVGRYAEAAKAPAAEIPAAQPASQFGENVQTGTGPRMRAAGQPPQPPGEGDAVLGTAEAAADSSVPPDQALQAYKDAKKKYGMFDTAEEAAEKEAIRLKKNNAFSVGDKAAAGIAATLTGSEHMPLPVKVAVSAAAGLGNKLVRGRGNAAAAIGFDKLGSLLEATPQAFGKYLPILQRARQDGGDQKLAVTHYLLMQQDPDYQRMMTAGPQE